jgi:hypothetical protein
MKWNQTIAIAIAAVLLAALVACGGSSTTTQPPPAISVAFGGTQPPASLTVNGTAPLTAVVSNDSKNGGVTWSCTPASACGTFNPTTTASGTATTYTAPATIPTGGSATVTATSVSDTSKSKSATITINPPAIVVSFHTTPPATLFANGTASLTADVANDAQNGGVNWTCAPASACGTFNPTQTASGAATTYTAPATVPTGRSVTVTATSVTDNAKSASASISIMPVLQNGTYIFQLSGTDAASGGFYSLAGAFVASNGTITGGEQDYVDYDILSPLGTITGGSYTISADGNLTITLITNDSNVGPNGNGIETLNAVVVSSSRALVTEYDASATSSGTLDLQTSTTAPAGSYVFTAAGIDAAAPAAPLAIGGVVNVDGTGTISGTGTVLDINDGGTIQGSVNLEPNTSSVTGPDQFGRVVVTLQPSVASGVPSVAFAGYIVDDKRTRLVETMDNLVGTTGGTALAQDPAKAGQFTNADFNGSTYVLGALGTDVISGPTQIAGLVTGATSSAVTGTISINDLAVQAGGDALTGSYLVDSLGRVNLVGLGDGTTFTDNFILYLTGYGDGVLISVDKGETVAGLAYKQTGTLTAASFSGPYGMNVTQTVPNGGGVSEYDGVGVVTADGVSALTGFVDLNEAYTPAANIAITGSYGATSVNGALSGSFTGLNVANPVAQTFNFYMIDATRGIAIETDNLELTLGYLELLH